MTVGPEQERRKGITIISSFLGLLLKLNSCAPFTNFTGPVLQDHYNHRDTGRAHTYSTYHTAGLRKMDAVLL
ncbi:hypothetical protein Y1Q_0002828 [Alligator mississippiensis]|uniref:Uncharacterized protein n=1 Tax=Alligator mississippiensis TaxID=8496 RepID=A0A151NZI4_ALLMI|nr:hypothetical protein Y1Q_0002828 [Alligator mississippiensis]